MLIGLLQKFERFTMKVCGFSFVRNGVKFDYPFEESIRSILPLCDKVIVAVGNSEDDTVQRVRSIDPKVEVLETVWDDGFREGGRVFAFETDKAFQAISSEYDWAFYIQGDEIVHEKYLPVIRQEMEKNVKDASVDGLLLKYVHFFGSYDFVGMKYSWYRREIRIVRNRKDIFSYRDAQGFRKKPNEKLNVKLIDAYVYHYGYVRDPYALKEKQKESARLYNDDAWIEENISNSAMYEYEKLREPVQKFTDVHPAIMLERIKRKNWLFKPDLSIKYSSGKDAFKRIMLKWLGWIPGEYRNYKILR